MKTITTAIQDGVSLAYISLLNDCTDLFASSFISTAGEIDSDLATIIKDMKIYISSLDTLINSNEDEKASYVAKLQAHHKTLENKFKLISSYNRELQHISFSLENKFYLKTTDPKDILGIDYHHFIHDALDFISHSHTEKERIYKTKEVLRSLPMRMTRGAFIDYAANSLGKITPNPLDEDGTMFLSVFKQMLDGRLAADYGTGFYDLGLAIEDFRNKSNESLSGEDIEVVFDDILLLSDTIDELIDLTIILHNMISYLSTLFIVDSIDFDVLSNQHVAFNDLFFTIKSLLCEEVHGEDYLILTETLPDRLDDILSEISEGYDKSTKEFYKKLEKGSFPQTEETLKLIKILSLIQFYLKLDISDIFAFDESTDGKKPLPISIIKEATELLDSKINAYKAAERKLRMQYLISTLPFIMDTQEFASYFHDAVEGTSSEVQKAFVLSKISTLMDSEGYFDSLLEKEQPQ